MTCVAACLEHLLDSLLYNLHRRRGHDRLDDLDLFIVAAKTKHCPRTCRHAFIAAFHEKNEEEEEEEEEEQEEEEDEEDEDEDEDEGAPGIACCRGFSSLQTFFFMLDATTVVGRHRVSR